MFYITRFREPRKKEGFHLVSNNWNDYGFYTLFKLYYVDENIEEKELGFTKVGYKDQIEGATKLPDHFEEVPEGYFSLGQDVMFYSGIRELGDELRKKCLNGLNDLAYNEIEFTEVMEVEENVFKTSLLRDLNIKAIQNQFRRVAHGGADLTRYKFNYNVSSENEDSKFRFEVIPESLPPTNIHTIIGPNGAGKTTALKGIVDGYFNEDLEADFSNIIFISFSIFDKHGYYDSENLEKEYYYVGVKTNDLKTKSQIDLKNEFSDSINKVLSKKRDLYLHKMLEILNADYNLKSFGFIEILERFMNNTDKSNEAVEEYSSLYGDIFDTLSSGHQIILMSIAKIVELIVEKTLILIDEPETHLHPPLISAFIRAVSEVSISENAVTILATHSPVVLQEVPKSCVSIIRKYGAQISIKRPRFETFGENVGVLTEEVFGLEIPNTGFHTLLRKVVEENPVYEEVIDLFNNELSIEAKSIVRTYINEINKN